MGKFFAVIDEDNERWSFGMRCNHIDIKHQPFVLCQHKENDTVETLAIFPSSRIKRIINVNKGDREDEAR